MNFQKPVFPLLVSAIALSASIVSALPAVAQSANPTAPPQREQMRRPNFLNLTPDQQAQLDQIREETRSQIEAVLTSEQRTQLQQERDSRGMGRPGGEGQRMPRPEGDRGMRREPFASLNLTTQQRSQIEAIMRSSREQMDAVLTSEQRQQLQEHFQQHQQRRDRNSQPPQPR